MADSSHASPTAQAGGRSDAIAEFVSNLRFEHLPSAVIDRLKLCVLDTLGSGIYGSITPWGRIVSGYAGRVAGSCPVWGSRLTSNAANAALANGTMVHSFEIDDLHLAGKLHPGPITLPVALALADEESGVTGRDLLTALAAGYEVVCRVGMCQGVSAFNRGWHPTGTAGVLGASATAARLLNLPLDATRHCLGIGGTMPAGLMAAQYGAMVKRLFCGHAAEAGVLAGRLAADGFTGIPDILDDGFGRYPQTISDAYDLDALTSGLGTRYEILNVGFKFYSSVGASHTTLDAVREILKLQPTSPDEVESIVIRTSDFQRLHAGWEYKPSTVIAAQMNMQYCVAALITEGEVFVDQFTEEKIKRPDLLALAGKVRVEADDRFESPPNPQRGSEVTLTRHDGSQTRAEVRFARGVPPNLPPTEQIVEKFRRIAGRVLPADQLDSIEQFVSTLEEAPDASALAKLLVLNP